ncbi:MAG: iron ABC transporter permease [Prevotellaceae bacterium]|jgi:iron complex transport system permease protein|nr:iron ABC transporter permease [Prevotellaceae bacterium]
MKLNRPAKYNSLFFTLLGCLLAVLFITDLTVGSVEVSLKDICDSFFGEATGASKILYRFRLPKACVAVFTGVSLSVAGLQMQTVFRNPLADPYVLGVSSGAGLGVALFIMGASSWAVMERLRDLGTYAAALGGSSLVLTLILLVSVRVKDVMSVLILGVMFGSGISAIISILQYFSPSSGVKTYVIWTMGSLGSVSSDKVLLMGCALLAGIMISVYSVKPLNALLLGENYAKSMGVNIRRSRNLIFLGTSILTGTATAFCGPIGFIGIAVPHLTRMLFRQADHRVLMPGTMLTGACIMLLCDILSQCVIKNTVLPINSVTALLGIPVIIFVIAGYNRKRRL